MASKAGNPRAPFYVRWGRKHSKTAQRSSSPPLTTSIGSPANPVMASVSAQTDPPASDLASAQTDGGASESSKAESKALLAAGTEKRERAAETHPAASEVKELAQQEEALRARIQGLREELAKARADARAEADALRAENAALQQQLSESEQEYKREVSGLMAALEEHREARARSDDERERFHYVLACNGQEGSVPRSVLASDRNSLLYKMYCGEWDYARDDRGRALITSHPQRWASVLEHLATGAVPAEWDPLLLAQARHWNLQRLAEGLEALVPSLSVTKDTDSCGFRARCTFVSVLDKLSLSDKEGLRVVFPGPQKRSWAVKVTAAGAMLGSVVPLTIPSSKLEDLKGIKASITFRLLLRDEELVLESTPGEFPPGKELFRGYDWVTWGYGLPQLLSEPLARAPGSLVIEVEVRYGE